MKNKYLSIIVTQIFHSAVNKVMHLKKNAPGFIEIHSTEDGYWNRAIHSRSFFSGDYQPLGAMRSYSVESLTELMSAGWSDATFSGYRWKRNEPHLLLDLRHCSESYGAWLCYWVADLLIDVHQKPSMNGLKVAGPLLTWEVTASRAEDNRIKLNFDFASDGTLSLSCQSIELLGDESAEAKRM